MSGAEGGGQFEDFLGRLSESPADQNAWAGLFRSTWPFVLAICHRALPAERRLLGAEDVAQEVYLKLSLYWHDKRPPVRDRETLLALLAVMARRLARDAVRWQNRARRDVAKTRPGWAQDIPAGRDHATDSVDLRDLLDKVLLGLDPLERQVLSFRLQEYHVPEIAEKLGVSTRTVERKLERIREVASPLIG